jgi:hypothetical protein
VLFAGLSCLVAVACIVASARRLAQAVDLTSLHPGLLLDALKGDDAPAVCAKLYDAVATDSRFDWERDLLSAFTVAPPMREALVNEQLTELDWRAQRWARIPRVCASVATSAGFLLASIALVQGLSAPADDDTPLGTREAIVGALSALAIGIAGTSFCYAVHVRARRIVRDRLAAVDRLIVRLESVSSWRFTPPSC